MAYKKPQIVAKSAAKQSFVAGCPTRKDCGGCGRGTTAYQCMIREMR